MSYRIMALNLGSTSFKFKYYPGGAREQESAAGVFENIGQAQSPYRIKMGDRVERGAAPMKNHQEAFDAAIDVLKSKGVLESLTDLDAVCYKAVHAGAVSGAREVNDELLRIMRRYGGFAPAHNAVYIAMMEKMRGKYPALFQLACFETAFHSTIPQKRAFYGVPWEWQEELGIRRYGFHGSSHRYIAEKIQEIAPRITRVISLHLGGSSSVCAIENGESVACSMGATPQSGLFQNNRVGDFDIFCLPALMQKYDGNLEYVLKTLSEKSGLLGVSGVSNDLREILDAAKNGNQRAALAVAAYCDNIVGYVGMFSAYLKGAQALVFTGGIGRNSAFVRKTVCDALSFMGITLDGDKNEKNAEGLITAPGGKIPVYSLETNEELTLLRETRRYLDALGR